MTSSLFELDSIQFILSTLNQTITRDSLANQINLLQNEKAAILEAKAFADSIFTISTLTLNGSISPVNIPDENEQIINEIILEASFTSANLLAQYNQLLGVAIQCPYMGGPAVYRARTLLSFLTDSLIYNDDDICALNGIYRGMELP